MAPPSRRGRYLLAQQCLSRGKEHRLTDGRNHLFFFIWFGNQKRGLWPVTCQKPFWEGGDKDHWHIADLAQQIIDRINTG